MTWKKEALLAACLASRSLASPLSLLLRPVSEPTSGFQHRPRPGSPGTLGPSVPDWNSWASSLVTEELPDSWPLWHETAMAGCLDCILSAHLMSPISSKLSCLPFGFFREPWLVQRQILTKVCTRNKMQGLGGPACRRPASGCVALPNMCSSPLIKEASLCSRRRLWQKATNGQTAKDNWPCSIHPSWYIYGTALTPKTQRTLWKSGVERPQRQRPRTVILCLQSVTGKLHHSQQYGCLHQWTWEGETHKAPPPGEELQVIDKWLLRSA